MHPVLDNVCVKWVKTVFWGIKNRYTWLCLSFNLENNRYSDFSEGFSYVWAYYLRGKVINKYQKHFVFVHNFLHSVGIEEQI